MIDFERLKSVYLMMVVQGVRKEGSRMIVDERIDRGTPFDWGRVSDDYARYRDIYPAQFYQKILDRGLCRDGQHVLDLGTGTGVIPRAMARYGAAWVGVDISEQQIAQARRLSEGMGIEYQAMPAEHIDFPDAMFDVITACQCFWYFDHEAIRGIGASLPANKVAAWEHEHKTLLERIAPERFDVLHYAAMAELERI